MFQNVKTIHVEEILGKMEDDSRLNFRDESVLGSLNNETGYQRRQDN